MARDEATPLRRGWTTGACAAAAARAAFAGLLTGHFPDPVRIRLPRGEMPSFKLALAEAGDGRARAGIVKDAGDDPDVTHGALIVAEIAWAEPGSGVRFRAGEGVGTVTRPGLQLAVGEPAINPAPRAMIRDALIDVAEANGAPSGGEAGPDVSVTIAIPGGVALAERTMNARLGIVGGLSVLGTTGIVVPYSCASWIHAIHRGIDVARAAGLDHIAAATGATSERAVQRLYDLPDHALIDMGDFVGGTLKYLRRRPVARLTLAGGFAKFAKLAQGNLDLHSSRSRVETGPLAHLLAALGADPAAVAAASGSDSASQLLAAAGPYGAALATAVARQAREVALATLCGDTAVEVAIVDRDGEFHARVRVMTARHVLILGGTGEAAAVARGALARFGDRMQVTTALAGRTRHPGPLAGAVRIGGFGGAAGLAAYLVAQQIDRLIDATHPFAAEISRSARLAAERTGVPRLMLLRPPWRRHPLDRWIEVDSIAAAASLVGRVGRRAWLTVGAGGLGAFGVVAGVHFVVRLIDRPRAALALPSHEVVLGRGPFSVVGERQLLARHNIDVLVCKASGGGGTAAKLIAARELGLPVIMVRRPRAEPGAAVETVEAALDWLGGLDQSAAARSMT